MRMGAANEGIVQQRAAEAEEAAGYGGRRLRCFRMESVLLPPSLPSHLLAKIILPSPAALAVPAFPLS